MDLLERELRAPMRYRNIVAISIAQPTLLPTGIRLFALEHSLGSLSNFSPLNIRYKLLEPLLTTSTHYQKCLLLSYHDDDHVGIKITEKIGVQFGSTVHDSEKQ